jgi:hypothetical protein
MPARDQHLPYWSRRPACPSARQENPIPALSKTTVAVLKIEIFLGVLGLIAGVMAQMMMAVNMFPPQKSLAGLVIGMSVFFTPLFATWLPVFCNQPLLSFRTYIQWCFYMSCCSVGTALLFEFYHFLGWLPIYFANLFLVARVVMHAGWLSLIPQLHFWILSRRSTS